MLRNSSQVNAACLQVQEEQHIIGGQPTPGEHLGGEEIDACQYRRVRTDEVSPTHLQAKLLIQHRDHVG